MNEGVETRSATLADVNYPKRLIELIVMPYEQETVIVEPARIYTEIVSRGAFAGVETRKNVRVNLEHERGKPIGRALRFHPSREEGLVAELKIAPLEEGERALVLADEGILDASAGFAPMRRDGATGPVRHDWQTWETRDRRRLNHLYLHHIALTAEPAYEGANVLAVRHTGADLQVRAATPVLDELRHRDHLALLADIDARYGLSR